MKKYIFCGVPSHGAILTVYKNLMVIFNSFDINLHWVGVGPTALNMLNGITDKNILAQGTIIAGEIEDEKVQATLLKEYIEDSNYSGYVVNVLFDKVLMNLTKYLDKKIIRIMLVHNITHETYNTSREIKDYVHHTICVSPRIYIDLITKFGFKVNSTSFIPNALHSQNYISENSNRPIHGKLKILSLGRIENMSKGLFLLPKIFSKLNCEDYSLTIAGSGPDKDELVNRLSNLNLNIDYIDWVDADNVKNLMSEHHIFIMPSMYEGFGLTLVEAMICGCVPIVTNIKGVTDYVVEDGYSGFLFKKMDSKNACEIIESLNNDRKLLNKISAQAKTRSLQLFDTESVCSEYNNVFSRIIFSNNSIKQLSIDDWNYEKTWIGLIKKIIPEPIKFYLRYFTS